MPFEKEIQGVYRGGRLAGNVPFISIGATGQLFFSSRLVQDFDIKQKDRIQMYFDAESKRIGIAFYSEKPLERSRVLKGKHGKEHTMQCTCLKFLRENKIKLSQFEIVATLSKEIVNCDLFLTFEVETIDDKGFKRHGDLT